MKTNEKLLIALMIMTVLSMIFLIHFPLLVAIMCAIVFIFAMILNKDWFIKGIWFFNTVLWILMYINKIN